MCFSVLIIWSQEKLFKPSFHNIQVLVCVTFCLASDSVFPRKHVWSFFVTWSILEPSIARSLLSLNSHKTNDLISVFMKRYWALINFNFLCFPLWGPNKQQIQLYSIFDLHALLFMYSSRWVPSTMIYRLISVSAAGIWAHLFLRGTAKTNIALLVLKLLSITNKIMLVLFLIFQVAGRQVNVWSSWKFYKDDGHLFLQDLNQPKVEANLPDGLMSVPLLRHQVLPFYW